MTLGEQFRMIRQQHGLSMRQVALTAHLKPEHYEQIEKNQRPYPRQATIDKICNALGCRVVVSVVRNEETQTPVKPGASAID